MKTLKTFVATVVLVIAGVMPAFAHCDSMDGPVVKAAKQALEKADVSYVLRWVQPDHEQEVETAFEQTLSVRRLSPEAQVLADRYFYETVVRLHREGEGAPYTGLKPAGRDPGLAIPAADEALETGSIEELRSLLLHTLDEGLEARFHHAYDRSTAAPTDVESGREFVRAYVEFIHYAEALYDVARAAAHEHPADEIQ